MYQMQTVCWEYRHPTRCLLQVRSLGLEEIFIPSPFNPYRRSCFLPLVTHKFRRGLEPSINPAGQRRSVLKPSGNLLVGFSGGLGSTVLLDMIYRCYYSEESKLSNQEKGGKDYPRNDVWKRVSVCWVDVCEAFPEVRPMLSFFFCRFEIDDLDEG
jgi:hypothetical protein